MNDSFDLYKRNTLRALVKRRLKEMEEMEATQRRTVEAEMLKLNHLRAEIDNLMRILKEMDEESNEDASSNDAIKFIQGSVRRSTTIRPTDVNEFITLSENKDIIANNKTVIHHILSSNVYHTDAGWLTKAEFALKRAERGLTLGQILDGIYEVDDKLKQEAEEEGGRRRHTTVLSPQLKFAVERGTFVREQRALLNNNRTDYVYYLSEWKDADGDIKPEYKRRN
jgi:hypothetical protein